MLSSPQHLVYTYTSLQMERRNYKLQETVTNAATHTYKEKREGILNLSHTQRHVGVLLELGRLHKLQGNLSSFSFLIPVWCKDENLLRACLVWQVISRDLAQFSVNAL